jgi:hypothetical protein
MMQAIYFHHFHKAAGTSIVNHLSGQYKLPSLNKNGNPIDEQGNFIELWNMGESDVNCYIDRESDNGVSLFVTEWGVPNLSIIKSKGVKMVILLREPEERLWSNYCYDISNRYFSGDLSHYIANPSIPYQRGDYYSMELETSICKFSLQQYIRMTEKDLYKYLFATFDEIILLRKGRFLKVKNADICVIDDLPRKNRTSSWRALLRFRRFPKKSEKESELIKKVCERDLALFNYLAEAR